MLMLSYIAEPRPRYLVMPSDSSRVGNVTRARRAGWGGVHVRYGSKADSLHGVTLCPLYS